jgi:hypothetical protein
VCGCPSECPTIIDKIRSDQSINGSNLIRWASFDDLYEAIREVTASNGSEDGESWLESDLPIVTEQERFLLRELVQMLFAERLIGLNSSDSVLVVPARTAVLEYAAFAAYICQPNRAFRPVDYIAFYHSGKIDRHIAKVLEKPIEETTLTEEGIINIPDLSAKTKQMFQELIIKMNADNSPKYKDLNFPYKVFFLSASDSPDTIVLNADIKNDLRNQAGNRFAFVQGQRYISLAAFKRQPRTTSELLGREVQ